MRCFIGLLLCSCVVVELAEGLQCWKCTSSDGPRCYDIGLTTEKCLDEKQYSCGTIIDYRRPDGGVSTAVNIERGCFYTSTFAANPGCQTFDVPEQKRKVSSCTRSCRTDFCNDWSTPAGP